MRLLTDYVKKRREARLKKTMAKYVEVLAKESPPTLAAPEKTEIHFILLQLNEDSAATFEKALTTTTEIVLAANGVVEDMMSSVVLITFGAMKFAPLASTNPVQAVDALMSALGSRVRLVHGRTTAFVGFWNGGRRMFVGSMIPNFARCLQRLTDLNFGTAKRIQ